MFDCETETVYIVTNSTFPKNRNIQLLNPVKSLWMSFFLSLFFSGRCILCNCVLSHNGFRK